MKTFTSFWLLCSPVKGNFILMCVDGKSMKVIAAYQKLHKVWDTASLALQLIKSTAVRWLLTLCWGTPRSASGHHSDSCLSPPPALDTPRGLKKATFHERTENVNQDAFMLFMMRYLWWQESRPAGLLVLSRPLPLQNMKFIFFKPAFYYQCLHTHQNNLLTKTNTNK